MKNYSDRCIDKKTKEFVKKYPWLKEMWTEFEKVSDEYWKKIEEINVHYTEISKRFGLECVSLWSNMDGGIVGIDVNDGYSYGGYDFEHNRMLIQSDLLRSKR